MNAPTAQPIELDMKRPITEREIEVLLEVALSVLPPEEHLSFLQDMASDRPIPQTS